jgi:hypothetical protein
VNILYPYDSVIIGTGYIQSLSVIHGVPPGLQDANVNVMNVTSNILLAYEDKIDGYEHLK